MPVVDEEIAYAAECKLATASMRCVVLYEAEVVAVKRCKPIDGDETNVYKQDSSAVASRSRKFFKHIAKLMKSI